MPILFKANKITGNLLVELARLDEPEYVGNYALIISANEQARAMLAMPQNALCAFEISKIALTGYLSRDKVCLLLTEKVIKNLTLHQRKSLHAIAEPMNRRLLEPYMSVERSVLTFPRPQSNFFYDKNEREQREKKLNKSRKESILEGVKLLAVGVLIVGAVLILIASFLGGWLISAPVTLVLLATGVGLFVLSFIAIGILEKYSTLKSYDELHFLATHNRYSQTSFSYALPREGAPSKSFQTNTMQQSTGPISYTPLQQNPAAYTHVLHQKDAQSIIEPEVVVCDTLNLNKPIQPHITIGMID